MEGETQVDMQMSMRIAGLMAAVATLTCAAAAQSKKDLRYQVHPGSSVTIINEFGTVNVRPASASQVSVSGSPRSNKVEVDGNQMGNRIEVRTHFLKEASPEDGRVDYDVQVPADADVIIRAGSGPVSIEKLRGDLTVEAETARVDVRDLSNGHLHIKTLDGPVTLKNVRDTYTDVTSAGGDVSMTAVTGPKLTISTTRGRIGYEGDFAGGGDYTFSSGSGNIDVSIPASASVSVTARSISGTVEDGFQFKPLQHPSFAPAQGKSIAGTNNAGAASVRLRSLSGDIHVRKQ